MQAGLPKILCVSSSSTDGRRYAPRGSFLLRSGERPVALLSAGIGATPVLAMLHALAAPQARVRATRHIQAKYFSPGIPMVRMTSRLTSAQVAGAVWLEERSRRVPLMRQNICPMIVPHGGYP